ncbi:MAG: prepilin peptidase [Methanomassiliicoccaceae archaeon]|nr:prepilin peptidase [Methanomassiliicoccaceae archaeon]
MEIEEILGLSAFIVAMAVLISASIKDWKEREIPDIHWVVLGVIGLAMFVSYSIYLTGFRWEYVCLAAGTAMILTDILWDKEFNPFVFYFAMAVLFIVPLYPNMSEDIFRAWASVPLCYLIFVGMYVLRIVRGGADVKCLIVLSILFPMYPQFFWSPLIEIRDALFSQIFVFSISVLFIAAVMVIPVAVYFAVRNAREGRFTKKMFSGYTMSISGAESSDVWPLEDIIDGRLTPIKIPQEEDISGIYDRLREAGQENVWVTPMIPFIVTITAATAILALIGNPLFFIV